MIIAVLLSACNAAADAPKIEVVDAWVRAASAGEMPGMMATPTGEAMGSGMTGEMGMGSVSAAYMVIKNSGGVADRLIRAESDAAQAVELHISEVVDGVMKMHPVDGIDVPANGQAVLEPGGLHIMLIGLKEDLAAGDTVTLTLVFEKTGEMTVTAEVRAP
jgi:hypothetical protein